MLEALVDWLTTSAFSNFFADRIWLIAVSQSIHILAVAVIMIAAAMVNLRLLGLVGGGRSFATMLHDYRPWIWWAMLVLLLTGTIQTIAEPAREIFSPAYQTKVVLLLLVVGITYYYQSKVRLNQSYWDDASHRSVAKVLAFLSLFSWVGILVLGRLIAYMGQDSILF